MSEGSTATATKSGGPDPLIGRTIADRFRITALLARGGMGKVYLAEQAPLGRLCAVKILNPNYNGDADPEFHRRFFREASITARITHPNSVTIFDYGKTDDEIYYMAMEYLEGQTLHHALRDVGTMPEDRVGRIAQQICRALREAHALDVIHRDLKPANIFLTRHGDEEDFVKVLDFGLVKQLTEQPEEQLTQTGLFMGSPKYMAPEQIQGAVVDARTDVYSLGIMLYEMLAGKVPFERATSVNILMAHVGEPPPPMRAVNPNLVCSPAFEELVMRCISKDPNNRYASMNEVLQGIKLAHGGSMTGQIAAVHASGAFRPMGALDTGRPGIVSLGTSALHSVVDSRSLSIPVIEGEHSGEVGASSAVATADALSDSRPRRSRAWIGFGVLVAAALGGGLGMAAFHVTTPSVPSMAKQPPPTQPAVRAVTATPAAASVSPAAPAVSNAPAASLVATTPTPAPAPPARTATLHVTTDPPGATVREDSLELCASTPCDVAFKGEPVDSAKPHRIVVTHPGYHLESRAVKASDGTIHVKLFRSGGGGARPAPQTTPAATKPAPTNPTPQGPEATPNGFKDLPY